MDVKQIRYILAIAEENSISRAAEKLFVTQSALNQQLLRLERELGLALFSRVGHSMTPTYAGSIYLENAQKILDIKENTYKVLGDISNNKRGEISISYTPERGSQIFSEIYPKFHALYPEFTFRIHEARGKKMEQLLEKKIVTIAMQAVRENQRNPKFDYHVVKTELMVLGMPQSHPLASLAGKDSAYNLPQIDIKLLENDYFVLLSHETIMRTMIDDLFQYAGFKPNVLFESTSTITVVNMIKNQICPGFFPQSYVDPSAPVVYFSTLPHMRWDACMTTRKDSYLSLAEKYLIRLFLEHSSGVMVKEIKGN